MGRESAIVPLVKRNAAVIGVMVCLVGSTACRGRAKTVGQLSLALQARGLSVEKVEPTADEKLLMEKFRALPFVPAPDWEEHVALRIDGVVVEVTRYSGSMKASSELKDEIDSEAKRKKRKTENHEPYDESRHFTNGPFLFTIDHWAVSAAPGGKMDMGSYRSLDIDPAVEQRIEMTIKSLKAGLF